MTPSLETKSNTQGIEVIDSSDIKEIQKVEDAIDNGSFDQDKVIELLSSSSVENNDGKKINIRVGRGLARTVLAAVLAAGLVIGVASCASSSNGDKTSPKPVSDEPSNEPSPSSSIIIETSDPTSSSSPVETTPSQTPNQELGLDGIDFSKYDYTKAPLNVVEGYAFEQLTPEQQAVIKSYEAMSVEEFQKLPQEKQIVYSNWILRNYMGRIEQIISVNDLDFKFYENPTTPEEILQNDRYKYLLIDSLCTNDDDINTPIVYDDVNGKKFMSMMIFVNQARGDQIKGWNTMIDSIKKTRNFGENFAYTLAGSEKTPEGYTLTVNSYDKEDGQLVWVMMDYEFTDLSGNTKNTFIATDYYNKK